jgi:hypothetical protein
MNSSSARVSLGDQCATFVVRKPRWNTQSSINQRCRGKIKRLTYAPPPRAKVVYYAAFELEYEPGTQFYPFIMRTGSTAQGADTPGDIVRRFATHQRKAFQKFPELRNLPDLIWEAETDDQYSGYVLLIPPRTALYSTRANFFRSMGFEAFMESRLAVIGGRGTDTIETNVYGFWNESYDEQQEHVALFSVQEDEPLSTFLDEDDPLPRNVQVQIEALKYGLVPFEIPGGPQPTDEDSASALLTRMGLDFADTCNLQQNPLEVFPVEQTLPSGKHSSYLLLKNRKVENSSALLTFNMSNELLQAFRMPLNRKMIFFLNDVRSYKLQTDGNKRTDPFRNLYPVTIVCKDSGEASSWVEGRGYVPLLAVMNDAGTEKTVDSESTDFEVDTSSLTLEFLDYASRVITFQRDVILHVLFKFKPIIPPQISSS